MRIQTLLTTCLVFCLFAPFAVQAEGGDEAIHQAILERLKAARDDFEYGPVSRSPLPGIYQVPIVGGPTLYTTASGDFAIAGELYQVLPGELVSVAEQERVKERREILATLDTDDMIIFPAKGGPAKAVINVFTDVDCGYCRRLHDEVPDLNKHGVEVRYLAFPRAGTGTATYDKMVRAWCSSDQQQAITDLKKGKNIKGELCDDNPVKEQFELGVRFGVTGTPSLVLADGTLVPGYRPWKDLLKTLGL